MEGRLQELEEKLQKNEQQRQKLKENLVSSLSAPEFAYTSCQRRCLFSYNAHYSQQSVLRTLCWCYRLEILQGEGDKHPRTLTAACPASG